MPYVPPGASSQSCIPRKAIASTVLEQTRRKVAAAGKSNSTSTSSGSKEDKQMEANGAQASTSRTAPASGVDMYAATSQLADDLGAAHIDQPEITIPKSVSSSSLAPSSSDAPSSSVSPTLSTSAKSHSGSDSDAVIAYKTALYTYTRDKLLETKGTGSPGKKAQSAYAQFGSKQSGMQKLAAKKLLARQLNA